MTNLQKFRLLSLIEGISFLLLLFVAMPAKYYFDYPGAVTVMGWCHGLLFLAYVYMATSLAQRYGWTVIYLLMIVVAGTVPFACFVTEKSLRRQLEALPVHLAGRGVNKL